MCFYVYVIRSLWASYKVQFKQQTSFFLSLILKLCPMFKIAKLLEIRHSIFTSANRATFQLLSCTYVLIYFF